MGVPRCITRIQLVYAWGVLHSKSLKSCGGLSTVDRLHLIALTLETVYMLCNSSPGLLGCHHSVPWVQIHHRGDERAVGRDGRPDGRGA